jgi:AraC-like DNA-binding protein
MKLGFHGIGKYPAGTPVGPAQWSCYDLIVVLEGSLTLEAGSKRARLYAHDAILIPPGTFFQGAMEKGGGEIWVQHFSAGRNEVPASPMPVREPLILRSSAGGEIVGALLRRLHELYSPQRNGNRSLRAALFIALLNELRYAVRNSNLRSGELSCLHQAATWAEQHLGSVKTLQTVARQANLSESHFRSLFRKWRSQSAGNWLRGLRMAEARRLLLSTGLPTKVISARVGFGDPVAFNRCFRRIHGMPPGRFRHSHPLPV